MPARIAFLEHSDSDVPGVLGQHAAALGLTGFTLALGAWIGDGRAVYGSLACFILAFIVSKLERLK